MICAIVVATALALLLIPCFYDSGASSRCDIYVDGALYRSVSLDTEAVIDTGTGVIVMVEDGTAYVSESDCPDKTCVRCHPVSRDGEVIVCLPNKVVVCIVSDETGVDAIA